MFRGVGLWPELGSSCDDRLYILARRCGLADDGSSFFSVLLPFCCTRFFDLLSHVFILLRLTCRAFYIIISASDGQALPARRNQN